MAEIPPKPSVLIPNLVGKVFSVFDDVRKVVYGGGPHQRPTLGVQLPLDLQMYSSGNFNFIRRALRQVHEGNGRAFDNEEDKRLEGIEGLINPFQSHNLRVAGAAIDEKRYR